MALENLDISMFTERSGVDLEGGDRLLLVTAQGNDGCVKVSLIMSQIRDAIQPSISELGTWVIGTTDTGVKAEGQTPSLKKGDLGIMVRYSDSEEWTVLIPWSDLKIDYSELTDEEKAGLKLQFSDLTEEDIAVLQQPAKDMITELENTNTSVEAAEALRVQAETKRVEAENARVTEFETIKTNSSQAVSDAKSAVETANDATERAQSVVSELEELRNDTTEAIDNANDTANHPTYVGTDNYVYQWNKTKQVYEKTNVYVKGDAGINFTFHDTDNTNDYDDVF